MKKTTNYKLSQYDATDRVTRSTFNADNLAIDTAIKAAATAAANAQSTANIAKTNAETALAAAQAAGRLRIETGTYTGTGTYSFTLPLDREPLLLLITMINYENTGAIPSLILAAGRGCTYANTSVATSLPQNAHVQCRWTDKGMYFHCYSHPEGCGNKQNTTYRYFAFYDDET